MIRTLSSKNLRSANSSEGRRLVLFTGKFSDVSMGMNIGQNIGYSQSKDCEGKG